MRLDLRENILFPFRDPSWIVKMLVGMLGVLLVLPFPMVVGYGMSLIRQTASGEDAKLPEWENPLTLWWQGSVLLCGLSSAFMLPFLLVSTAATLSAIMFGGAMDTIGLAIGGLFLGLLILIAASAGIFFLVPAMVLRYVMTETTGTFFDVTNLVLDIKQGVPDYLAILLFPALATLPLMLLNAIPGVGTLISLLLQALFTVPIIMIAARMLGKFYLAYFIS
jgi:hypothetical protein